MAKAGGTGRGGRLRTAEKLALGVTALTLALTVGFHLGLARSAPEVTVRSESLVLLPEAPSRALPAEEQIDLNSASAEELQTLKGIGPALAERIVAYRTEHGPFQRIEDITRVKGIGFTVFEENRTRLCIGEGAS